MKENGVNTIIDSLDYECEMEIKKFKATLVNYSLKSTVHFSTYAAVNGEETKTEITGKYYAITRQLLNLKLEENEEIEGIKSLNRLLENAFSEIDEALEHTSDYYECLYNVCLA